MKYIACLILFTSAFLQAEEEKYPQFAFSKSTQAEDNAKAAAKILSDWEFGGSPEEKGAVVREFIQGEPTLRDARILASHLGYEFTDEDKVRLKEMVQGQAYNAPNDEAKGFMEKELNEFLEGKSPAPTLEDEERAPVRVLDANKDGKAEFVLIPDTYFGPTSGYVVYAKFPEEWGYLFDNSGAFTGVEKEETGCLLRFQVTMIEAAEPEILQTFYYDFTRGEADLLKQYYPSQLETPEAIDEPIPLELSAVGVLRSAPKVDDAEVPKGEEAFNNAKETLTVRGNVVAEFEAGGKGYVLAKKDGWIFAAIAPESKLTAVSMFHGMDSNGPDNTPDIIPFWCGWIAADQVKVAE